jgi:hypothetical protein
MNLMMITADLWRAIKAFLVAIMKKNCCVGIKLRHVKKFCFNNQKKKQFLIIQICIKEIKTSVTRKGADMNPVTL